MLLKEKGEAFSNYNYNSTFEKTKFVYWMYKINNFLLSVSNTFKS